MLSLRPFAKRHRTIVCSLSMLIAACIISNGLLRHELLVAGLASTDSAAITDKRVSPQFSNPTSTVFINEILYDITGTDAGEFIEVAAPAGTNMANYSIVLYNGSGGAVYDTDALSGTTSDQQGGYGFASISYPSNGIQNGAPDGVALINTSTNTLVQFLCYEGTFVGVGGLANGVTCTDIGVSQSGTNAAGTSLQLQGTGTTYGDFTWNATSIANTQNAANTGQTFTGGGGQPTLSINDVTQAETNSGTTTFTFSISLSAAAGAGGVTFDIATADGTAQDGNLGGEDTDYVARSLTGQTISSGNSNLTFDVTVNGDTTTEANETFFVNVTNISGATAGDTQGQGTISNDDVTITPICQIQGNGTASPMPGASVTATGIVTGLKSNGFFIQQSNCDADSETSDGIFVFTSSAPPAGAAIGNSVQVSGTVQDFVPSSDPNQNPLTELGGAITVNVLSTGNSLPAPIVLTAADTTNPSEVAGEPLDTLEEYEGMRVTVPSFTVTGATQGSITESSATVSSNGVFLGVVTSVARPFREAGIAVSDPLPPGAPGTIPRFDENPERIRVDSDAQPGSTAIDVAAGTIITDITGPLDYGFRAYTIDPDAATPPIVGTQPGSVPVPTPTADELTIASFNMERFFDTVNDPGSDPVLTGTAFSRRVAKASLIIRTVQMLPDVIGVEELENLSTLQTVAAQVNNDVVGGGGANPNYQAYLVEGNDIGGIDVGFLVKTARVTVHSVTQIELAGCDHVTPSTCNNYTNPNDGSLDILNDRPPLVLIASIPRTAGGLLGFTVIANHLRSLNGIDDSTADGSGTVGARVREKRRKQAEFLANYTQDRQAANPNEKIITLGDMNAFRVNDGYVDSIGTILGTPAPADQVVSASSDLVNPNQTDLLDTLVTDQRYSYNFDGNAQTLDHIIVNPPALALLTRFAYARNDSDFAVKNYESTNELRIADHDQPVAYFSLNEPTAANGVVRGRITTPDGAPLAGAVVNLSGSQSRKTITDTNGGYHFDNVATSGFYTVTPVRVNYSFAPANRSFSLIGSATEAAFTATGNGADTNPLDTTEYFVRQQYVDLLGREPDEGGFNYWSDEINRCGDDASCVRRRRLDIAAAFFVEQEFQQTGSFIYNVYKGALGRRPWFSEYAADRGQVVAAADLEARKDAFLDEFLTRAEFVFRYQASNTADAFVTALLATVRQSSGTDLAGQREALIVRYLSGSTANESRRLVLRDLAESPIFRQAEYNAAFVLTEYFAYLRRNPDPGGYDFWVNVLNHGEPGNYRGMVCAFITAPEYQRRFSALVSHDNGECAR